MAKARINQFYIRANDDAGNALMTSIQVTMPPGLTRNQAVEFVAGRVAAEIARYGAWECLGLGTLEPGMDWNEIVT